MRSLFAAAIGAATFIAILLAPARAHEGHDHGEAKPLASDLSAAPRGEATSSAFELVAIARERDLLLYLDRFDTNEPVEGAVVEVETPEGSVRATATPGDGYRLPAPWLDKPGSVDLIVTVTTDQTSDILPVTLTIPVPMAGASPAGAASGSAARTLVAVLLAAFAVCAGVLAFRRRPVRAASNVLFMAIALWGSASASAHDGEDHGNQQKTSTVTGDLAKRLPDGSVFVPKPTQRIFAVRTIVTIDGVQQRTTELPGRVIPDPNASGFVQSAIGGRLSAAPGGFPRLGTQVKEGDVLAYVTPPMQAIDVSDMRQRQGELDQQISISERRLARFEALAPSGAVARSQLEDARSELQGLKERRSFLDKARREPEALIAPVSGLIADGNAVAGQIVQPNAVVFHIIDQTKLWVEALSFDAVLNAQAASAKTSAGNTFPLSYRGSGFTDRSQSIPVHFAIDGDPSGLRAGQFVSVLVNTKDFGKGIAIPRSSLVRSSNGQDIIFEHKSAEIFVPRPVRVDPLDGDRVLVAAGLESGMRVVTQGGELLDLVR